MDVKGVTLPDPIEHMQILLSEICNGDLEQAIHVAEINLETDPGPYWTAIHQGLTNLRVRS